MSLGFNLSTKKEDVSTRLKVQNLKRAKVETKKLENEGRRMEERLSELKLAMSREKEERERQGGGFWKMGQQGSLTTYADEVLAKQKKNKSASSKGKIKILRDKPLDLPERSNQPGTMAFIAQRGSGTPRDKPRGPRCGQCEDRSAAVSCMQCSEDYCAGCFAAFHLKGNLKKHRSVPIAATPRQCFASPRPNPSSVHSSYNFDHGDEAILLQEPVSSRKKDRNSPEGASGTYETNSLLQGSYNEAEQAASFQEALQAWRTGKAADNNNAGASHNGEVRPQTDRSQRSQRSERSRGSERSHGSAQQPHAPAMNVDSSTGTSVSQQDIEITFNTSSMTYAERLLLKKHRRTDVDTLFTPRGSEGSDSGSSRVTPRYSAQRGGRSHRDMAIEDFNEGDFDADERVDFSTLYAAVKDTETDTGYQPDPDSISIVELKDQGELSSEQTVAYKVQEEGARETWSTDSNGDVRKSSQFEVKPPSSAKSSRRKSGRKSVRSSQDASLTQSSELGTSKPVRIEEPADDLVCRDTEVLGSRLNDIENEVRRESTKSASKVRGSNQPTSAFSEKDSSKDLNNKKVSSSSKPPSSARSRKKADTTSVKDAPAGGVQEMGKARPESAQSRAKSSKGRPQTGTRAQSRQGNQSRQGSRPGSRAGSRLGSARTRPETPGLLTKVPSTGLQEVARMAHTGDSYRGIDSFFMVGVTPGETNAEEERVLTPTQHKQSKDEKIKVSYQLYSMAPRSWKPDNSVMDAVPADDVDTSDAEDDRASSVMAYHAISEQMVTDITERLISRFDELPLDDDSMSDQSSSGGGGPHRSLGEEYRTRTPCHSHGSSVQNSPSMSARATPVSMRRSQVVWEPNPARDSVPSSAQSARRAGPVPSQTPRQSARSRAQTPQAGQSRTSAIHSARRSKTFHGELERPVSRAIVMDGEDLSMFDVVGERAVRDQDDEETLDQLEWELASQSGRITAEGTISRMEMPVEAESDDSVASSLESFRSRSRLGQDQGYDINSRLRKEELDDEDEVSTDDESDVRNLM